MSQFVKSPCENPDRLTVRDAAPATAASAPVWTLVAAVVASSMAMIDGTAVNVALPMMQRGFNATSPQMQWVVEGYALFLSAFILLGGALGDKVGRRRVFLAGVVVFTAASAACAAAQTIPQLILFRCAQGFGAAFLTPGSLSLISAAYAGEARGRAIGTWSAFSFITTAIGPLLGGWLAQSLSWRYVFLINLPLAAGVYFISRAHIAESRDPQAHGKLDVAGSLLAVTGLGALVYGLIEVQARTTPAVIGAIVFGIAVLLVFVFAEMRAESPIMPLALFKSRRFSVANLYTLLLYSALGGSLYFVPFFLINVHRYTPFEAGAALLPMVAISFSLSRFAGGLAARIGPKVPLVFGAFVTAIAFLAYARIGTGGTYWTTFFPAVAILGIGVVSFVAPLTTTVMNSVSTAHAGAASGINNAVARTAGLVAIAVFGIALAYAFNAHFNRAMSAGHFTAATQRMAVRSRGVLLSAHMPAGVPDVDRARLSRAVDDSFTAGFRAAMLLGAALCAAAAVCAFAFRN